MSDFIPPSCMATLPQLHCHNMRYANSPVWLAGMDKKAVTAPHWHDFFEIWHLIDGEYVHTISDIEYTLTAGTTAIIPPYVIHHADTSKSDLSKLHLIRLYIKYDEIPKEQLPLYSISHGLSAFNSYELPLLHTFNQCDKETADGIIFKIIEEIDKKKSFSLQKAIRYTHDFLKLCTDASKDAVKFSAKKLQKAEEQMKTMRKAENYIQANYASNISLDSVAEAVSMSRRAFTNAFHDYFGMTCHEYISSTRLYQAYLLIRAYSFSIAEVAERCGFANSSHLSLKFSDAFGCTPVQYRHYYAEWQKKWGDALYQRALKESSWFATPDEEALIRHYTSMRF